jgi:hypothetical protein
MQRNSAWSTSNVPHDEQQMQVKLFVPGGLPCLPMHLIEKAPQLGAHWRPGDQEPMGLRFRTMGDTGKLEKWGDGRDVEIYSVKQMKDKDFQRI